VLKSKAEVWQTGMDVYSTFGVSLAEISRRIGRCGKIGAYLLHENVHRASTRRTGDIRKGNCVTISITEAYRILAVSEDDDRTVVKKAYRKLMHRVHPDALAGRQPDYEFSAQDINAAYELILEHIDNNIRKTEKLRNQEMKGKTWSAPENPYAYTDRNIYVDRICVASGKYFLSEDEDFHMFLLSIYNCSRKILADFPDEIIKKFLGETAYLLSQQFVDREDILSRYEIESENKTNLYYFPAMLETEGKRCALQPGTVLTPAGMHNHRLYVKSPSGRETGYISFSDDRIYYALIPLFELRLAEVKIRVSGSIMGNNNVRSVKVRTLDLWVRIPECDRTRLEITLSGKISQLLEKARDSNSF